ncbi:MAG TPA: FAD-dependent oxidoreductase, partial [Fimbriimonadaceae bacterium]|nr:FAD-dependent oxidoreductase [Fimbriimonadaceae bacterium]
MPSFLCDVLIIGGGTGGCAAALAACGLGKRVIMTEEFAWIGGQLTSQAVPPDENPWIETFGGTASYQAFREGVRKRYRTNYPLTDAAKANPLLNPGSGWVSRLCHEPKI